MNWNHSRTGVLAVLQESIRLACFEDLLFRPATPSPRQRRTRAMTGKERQMKSESATRKNR
jgi:hypothetical protein